MTNTTSAIGGIPFIIWTLQRTGGTNFTQQLVNRSGMVCVQHEPFNKGRMYGDIVEQWREFKNDLVLADEIQAITNQHVIIKHCVEMIPWEISSALANAAINSGYRHLFLYRKNSLDRLLSLNFAEKTGVWGPAMQSNTNEHIKLTIPVDRLVAHERKSIDLLQQAWDYLKANGANLVALSYEDLYRTSLEHAKKALDPVFEMLNLSNGFQADSDFVFELINQGDQGTRDKYEAMQGIDELEQALLNISVFNPKIDSLELSVLENSDLPLWVCLAKIDDLPDSLPPNQFFSLGGVVVLEENAPEGMSLSLLTNESELLVEWNIDSPRMEKLYPNNAQSAKARFKSNKISAKSGNVFVLVLKHGETNYPLFTITLA